MSNSFSTPPSKVKGRLYRGYFGTPEMVPQYVVNVKGQGTLLSMSLQLEVPTDGIEFRILIDTLTLSILEYTGDVDSHPVIIKPWAASPGVTYQVINETDVRNKLINFDFDSRLIIHINRAVAGTGIVYGEVYYSLITP